MGRSTCIASLIDISVDLLFQAGLKETWLRTAIQAALDVALIGETAPPVSLVVTVDETVRALNRDYRGLDEVTDVLSFSASYSGHWEGEGQSPAGNQEDLGDGGLPAFVYPPGEPAPLGEVIIAYPQAHRQASARGVPLDRELALLIVHGVLHLAGYDHLEAGEEAEMQAKEQAALQLIPGAAIPQVATT